MKYLLDTHTFIWTNEMPLISRDKFFDQYKDHHLNLVW